MGKGLKQTAAGEARRGRESSGDENDQQAHSDKENTTTPPLVARWMSLIEIPLPMIRRFLKADCTIIFWAWSL
jgi:hypothetical protein